MGGVALKYNTAVFEMSVLYTYILFRFVDNKNVFILTILLTQMLTEFCAVSQKYWKKTGMQLEWGFFFFWLVILKWQTDMSNDTFCILPMPGLSLILFLYVYIYVFDKLWLNVKVLILVNTPQIKCNSYSHHLPIKGALSNTSFEVITAMSCVAKLSTKVSMLASYTQPIFCQRACTFPSTPSSKRI